MCRGTTLVQVLANAIIGKRPIRYGRYLDSFAADWPARRVLSLHIFKITTE
jgi:hypothetical protein